MSEAFSIEVRESKDPGLKGRGHAVCNWLALSRCTTPETRGLARHTLHWYAEPATALMASIEFRPLTINTPEGFTAGNISIVRIEDAFVVAARAVNYEILENGLYNLGGDTSFRSRILLLNLDSELTTTSVGEVHEPDDLPPPRNHRYLGFEDPRIFLWRGDLWTLCSVCQLNDDGRAEMVLARIDRSDSNRFTLTDWRLAPAIDPALWQKNWMPQVVGEELRFIYSLDPTRIVTELGALLLQAIPEVAVDNFKGGSQAIAFDDGWLVVIHEWELVDGRRCYMHRLVWLDANHGVRRLSRRFYFKSAGVEFASGLAWHVDNKRLVIGFSIGDREPFLAIVDADDVRAALLDIDAHREAAKRAGAALKARREAREQSHAPALEGPGIRAPCKQEAALPSTGTSSTSINDQTPLDRPKFVPFSDHGQEATCDAPAAGEIRYHLVSHHGTILYADIAGARILHAPLSSARANLALEFVDSIGRLIVLADSSATSPPENELAALIIRGGLDCRIEQFGDGSVGIRVGESYLSADLDGVVRNDRDWCREWERFRLVNAGSLATDPDARNQHRQKISAFVISYNGEAIIETCLRSLRFADELIVVDKSSGDRTRAIADLHADIVVVVPWTPTVEDTRHYALSLCSHDWIIYLDDDECLSPAAIRFFIEESSHPSAEIYSVPRRDYYLGRYDKRRRDWPDHKDRFFRRGALEFQTPIHSSGYRKSSKVLTIAADSPICIYHLTSASVSDWIERTNRDTSQTMRDSWYADARPLSADFVKHQLDYWIGDRQIGENDFPTAYALMRVVYDIVDRLKRWEAQAGLDASKEYERICASLRLEYDELERSLSHPAPKRT